MFKIILVGFLPNDNGRSCILHPFGGGNSLVLEKDDLHGVQMKIWLRLVILRAIKFNLMDLMVVMSGASTFGLPTFGAKRSIPFISGK